MEIKERIKIIMEKENMQPKVFAEKIGIKQATLSHILTGRNRPSLEVIMKINQVYQNINLKWLLYGEGEMYSTGTSISQPLLFDTDILSPSKTNYKEKEMSFNKDTNKENTLQDIKYTEKACKKIIEIRIFFDDNTYEIFKPEK